MRLQRREYTVRFVFWWFDTFLKITVILHITKLGN